MPAPQTCDEFLEVLRDADLVEEQALTPFLDQWQQASAGTKDVSRLADGLLQAGLVTSFQKKLLLEGKRRGYIIADKYVLLNHLGAGGMGSVWLCEHKVMRRRVAIKVLPTAYAKNPEYVARFHREARAVAALDHANIVRAFDVDHDDKMHFLVMEYVDGQSLQDLVNDQGLLEIRQACDYISQAAAGLQHAHEAGLVHRDIKPGNLLVDRKGVVKVLDMGLALFFQDQGKSLTQQYDANAVLGTAEYLAPEQAVDSHGVDIRADVYSLGLTFYFLLTEKSPYGDQGTIAQKLLWHQLRTPRSVQELRPEVPDGLAAVITKMLAKDRADRYQTPAEVVAALAPWVQGTPAPEPRQVSAPSTAPSIARKGPETIRACDIETMVEADERNDSAPRSGKRKPQPQSKIKGDKPGKSSKSGKIVDELDERDDPDEGDDLEGRRRSKGKGSPSSAKHRRKKSAAVCFWTTSRIVIASVGSGALVVAVIFVLILVSNNRSQRLPGVKTPVAQVPGPRPNLAPPVTIIPAPPVNNPPTKVDPAPKPAPPAPPKTEPPKTTPPPPKATPTPPKTEPPKSAPMPKEPLASFFPKAGATLLYTTANYTGATKVAVQQKWEFKDGVIHVAVLKYGVIENDTLLKNGKVRWAKNSQGKDQAFFRAGATHIEMGQLMPGTGNILWEPILPVAAAEKDTWKWKLPSGDFKEYLVVKFDSYKGKRAVIIQDSMPFPQGGKIVTTHTYVASIGEVTRTQSLEKTGAPPKLLGEAKLIE